jgi:manganese transport system substrate-binding protein
MVEIRVNRRPTRIFRARGGALAAVVLTALVACASAPDAVLSADPVDKRPVVLTTFTVLADIAQNVAGDHLRVESITKVGAEIHGYQPTPGDIAKAADADLILDNGLNLEAWFAQFVDGLDVPHVVVSEGVETISIAEDAYAGLPNPHAWMSPLNAQIYVDNMAAAFATLDPDNAADYAANAEAYKAELQAVSDELTTELATIEPSQRALVTCEGAFSYLARDAGLSEHYLWAVNAEQQSTPRQVAAVIDFVRANNVPAVFCESTVSDRTMQQVVEASDAVFGGTLYVDSLSAADGPVPTYLELLRHDTQLIIDGLTGGGL